MDDDLRAVADYLFELAERDRASGHSVRATAIEHIAEDFEAELAIRARLGTTAAAVPLQPAS